MLRFNLIITMSRALFVFILCIFPQTLWATDVTFQGTPQDLSTFLYKPFMKAYGKEQASKVAYADFWFLPSGRYLAIKLSNVEPDGQVWLLDIQTNQARLATEYTPQIERENEGRINLFGRYSRSGRFTIIFHHVEYRTELQDMEQDSRTLANDKYQWNSVKWSRDDEYLVYARWLGSSGGLHLTGRKMELPEEAFTIADGGWEMEEFDISPDAPIIAYPSRPYQKNHSIIIYDLESRKELASLPTGQYPSSIYWGPDNWLLYSTSTECSPLNDKEDRVSILPLCLIRLSAASYYLERADRLHDDGMLKEAHEAYLRAESFTETAEEKKRVYGSLTVTYYKMEDYGKSREYCKKLLKLSPDSEWANRWLKKVEEKIR